MPRPIVQKIYNTTCRYIPNKYTKGISDNTKNKSDRRIVLEPFKNVLEHGVSRHWLNYL